MMAAGFIPISHPTLRETDFDGDQFHYSRGGMRKVVDFLIKYVDQQ
jgi:hypothetical protein